MIISHENRFIFIKTAKTAGTSLEIALSKYCGPDDIITPISPKDEALRVELGYRGAQYYLKSKADYRLPDYWRRIKKRRPIQEFYNHISAQEVSEKIPADIWNSYFKFSVVRNPFDRAVSRFFWRHTRKNKGLSPQEFRKFLLKNPEALTRNREKTKVDGEVAMDFMVRYENFEEDLSEVSRRIGIAGNLYEDFKSLNAKKGHRPKGTSARELFAGFDEGIQAVLDVCSDDIKEFGYSPPVDKGHGE